MSLRGRGRRSRALAEREREIDVLIYLTGPLVRVFRGDMGKWKYGAGEWFSNEAEAKGLITTDDVKVRF